MAWFETLAEARENALAMAAECEAEGNPIGAKRHRERAAWYQSSIDLRDQEMPTLCETCDNVESGSRKMHPAKWLCLKHKRCAENDFVSPTYYATKEPYVRCVSINHGDCPLWQKKRIAPDD